MRGLKALSIVALLLALVSACQSGQSTPTAAPRAAATEEQPTATPTAHSAPTRTGLPGGSELEPSPTATGTSTATEPPPATEASDAERGIAGIGDPFYPQLGNAGYDAQHYTLDLTVDVLSNTISGTLSMRAIATQDLTSFNLDFVSPEMEIVALQVGGEPADYDDYDDDPARTYELNIRPGTPLASAQAFTTTVAYRGEPQPYLSQAASFRVGWIAYPGGTFAASEPDGAASWYPVNDHPIDKATYTFRITVPATYTVAANGLLQETLEDGNARTFVWETRHPVASYLVTVNIAEYVMHTEEGPDGLPIRNFFPPEMAEEAAYDFGRTSEMIALFNDLFGPYPFEAYGVAIIGDVPFALETQTLSIFSSSTVSGRREAEAVVAHELVHQWFGDSVSLAQWKDIWLNEGFATYGEFLWLEHTQGPVALEEGIRQLYNYIPSFPPPGSPPPDDLFNQSVYTRGAMTLHALRMRVGDEVFFDILRTYHDRFRYGNASTEDFIEVAEAVSDQQLDAFFDGWLYQRSVPDIPEMGLSRPGPGS